MAQGPSDGLEGHHGNLRDRLASIYTQLPAVLVRLSSVVGMLDTWSYCQRLPERVAMRLRGSGIVLNDLSKRHCCNLALAHFRHSVVTCALSPPSVSCQELAMMWQSLVVLNQHWRWLTPEYRWL